MLQMVLAGCWPRGSAGWRRRCRARQRAWCAGRWSPR